ncbi:MAG: hypothetical protein K1W06_00450 [Lachnospiraceae bacterium]
MENIILFQKETNKNRINNKKSKKTPEKADINGSRAGCRAKKKTLGKDGRRGGKNRELSGKNN